MELLAPVGGPEQLKAAIHFGADAVYLAGDRFGLRQNAGGFAPDELARACALAHEHGVAVHVAVNVLMHEDDLDGAAERASLEAYLAQVAEAGADAVIAGDLGTIAVARRVAPALEVHASTQLSCANHEAARVLYELGCSRVVLARELSVAEIARLRQQAPADLELEAFAHGAMCMAVSGRCLISSHLNARSANRGACTQPCRWTYTLEEEQRPGIHFPIVEDARGTSILSSKDLMMLDHLDDLARAGVGSIKIEGRAKGAYYVATVVNAYRQVLDGADPQELLGELDAVSHRPYHTGFYYGAPDQTDANREYRQVKLLVGFVDGGDATAGTVDFTLRNRVTVGQELEVLSPGQPVRRFTCGRLYNLDQEAYASTGNRNGERYRIEAPFPIGAGDILRRACEPHEVR